MNTSLITALFCIVLMVTLVFGAPSVTMTWENDHFIKGDATNPAIAPGTNQLRIKLTDIPLDDAKFYPALTTDETATGNTLTTYNLVSADEHYKYFHQSSKFGCTDAKTGQAVLNLINHGDGSFGLAPLTIFTQQYPSWVYTVEVLCPFAVINDANPDSININFDYTADTITQTLETALAFPTKGFISPMINFQSVKIGARSNILYSSTEIDIEFTTDTLGVYEVTFINGLYLDSKLSFTNKDETQFFCSAGEDEQFATLHDSYIYVTKPTTSIIKCRFYTVPLTEVEFVSSERGSIKLSLLHSSISVSRNVDLESTPGVIIAELQLHSSTSVTLSFIAVNQISSSTPINTNSTIEIKLSPSVNVAHLVIDTDTDSDDNELEEENENPNDEAYRGFVCSDDDGEVRSTIFVNAGANTITLKDIDRNVVGIYFTCMFNLNGSDVIDFNTKTRQGTLSAKIDGESLTAFHAPDQLEQPLHFRTRVDIDKSPDVVTETDTTVTIVHSFNISDMYSTYFTTLGRPVALFALRGNSNFKEEDRQSQLSCKKSSPQSTKLSDIKLTFDSEFGFWRYELKNIQNHETFDIKLICTRTINKVMKFGRDITPIPSLYVDIVDFIDDRRYSNITPVVFHASALTTPTKQTQEYPAKTIVYAQLDGKFVIPQGELTTAITKSAADNFQSVITSKITSSTALTTYTSAFTTVGHVDSTSVYYSLTAPVEYYNYITKSLSWATDLLSFFLSGGSLKLDIFDESRSPISIEKVLVGLDQHEINVNQLYKTSITKAEWDDATKNTDFNNVNFNEDVYTSVELNKNRLTDMTLLPDQTLSPHYSIRSPVEKCGYEAGAYVTHSSVDFSYGPTTSISEADAWDAFTKVTIHHLLCETGETCSVNADCTTGNCSAGVCNEHKRIEYPFTHWQNVFALAHKDFFNSSNMISTISAMVVVAIAMTF